MDPSPILASHSWWHAHGETIVWAAAVIAALGVIVKTPIGQFFVRGWKWVWRRLISEPITDWSKRTVGAVVEDKIGFQFTNNGGNSLRDVIDGLATGQESLTDFAADASGRQDELVAGYAAAQAALIEMGNQVGTTFGDHGTRITALETGQDEVLAAIERLHECIESKMGAGETDAPQEAEPA